MQLSEFLANRSAGVNIIKLKDLLTLRANYSSNKAIQSLYPPIEIGSITLVDQIVLLSLAEITQPKKIIEIGTYLGYTTSLLAMNTKATEIYTIDLPKGAASEGSFDKSKILLDDKHNDDYLRYTQEVTGEIYLNELSTEQLQKVKLIKQDSTKIDFSQYFGQADYIFIDGGHETDIVRADTENARSIITKGVIIWHDYASGIHSDVTTFLQQQASPIFHVQGSLCAFQLIGFEG